MLISMAQQGYIKLHRQFIENDIYFSEPFTRAQAWIDLLLLANYKETTFFKRGVNIVVPRGSLARSIKELCDRWKWSNRKVVNFLNYLEKASQITYQKTNVTTLISVVNYDDYQTNDSQSASQTHTRSIAEASQKHRRSIHTIKDNKEKKEKNSKEVFRADEPPKQTKFIPPTVEEVKAFIEEKKYNVDAEHWHDFYTAKNWMIGKNKMRDWQAAVRTWTKNRDGTKQQRINYDEKHKYDNGVNTYKVNDKWKDKIAQAERDYQKQQEQGFENSQNPF